MKLTISDNELEIWKYLDFLNIDNYFISNFGRVWSTHSYNFINGYIKTSGYKIYFFNSNNKRVQYNCHQLVQI